MLQIDEGGGVDEDRGKTRAEKWTRAAVEVTGDLWRLEVTCGGLFDGTLPTSCSPRNKQKQVSGYVKSERVLVTLASAQT